MEEKHNVTIFSFFQAKTSVENRLCPEIAVYSQKEYSCSDENIKAMRKVLIDNKIDIIVNQWGLPYLPISVAIKASKGLDIKIISVHHNNPAANGKLYDCDIGINKTSNKTKRSLLILKKSIICR